MLYAITGILYAGFVILHVNSCYIICVIIYAILVITYVKLTYLICYIYSVQMPSHR